MTPGGPEPGSSPGPAPTATPAAAPPPGREPEPKPVGASATAAGGPGGFFAAHRRRLSQAVAGATAIVGLAVGLITVIDWTRGLGDDPPPPAAIDARVAMVDLRSTHEPLEGYLTESSQSLEGLTRPELEEEGLLFAVRVRFKGSTKASFPMRWSLYDARADRRLRDEIYNQDAGTFTPRGPDHARTWLTWVPYPPRPGTYRLRVTLTDEKGQPVDSRDSREFRITSVPDVPT